MEVKMLAPMREHTIFSVDARKIEVPHTCRIGKDEINFSDSLAVYYTALAVDAKTREPVDDSIKEAIADYIKELDKEDGGDMKVVMTVGGNAE